MLKHCEYYWIYRLKINVIIQNPSYVSSGLGLHYVAKTTCTNTLTMTSTCEGLV